MTSGVVTESDEDRKARAAKRVLTGGVLEVEQVTVSFDGFKALDDLSMHIVEGELRCLIGPNGAGKTTLMDVITGKTRADSGTVRFDGNNLADLTEHQIAERGIGRKFQRPTVFPSMTAFENLELALNESKGVWHGLFRRLRPAQLERIDEVLEAIGLVDERESRAGNLSHGQTQWLEIGMLLAQDPKLLLVDEPVAGMSPAEVERTSELLSSLAGDHTLVVVEHDMEFVRGIARTVTVLHEGRVIAEGPMAEVQSDPRVIEVYLGEQV